MTVLPAFLTFLLAATSVIAVPKAPQSISGLHSANKEGELVSLLQTPASRQAKGNIECVITRYGLCKKCFRSGYGPCFGILYNGREVQKKEKYYTDTYPDIGWNTDIEAIARDAGAKEEDMLECMGFTFLLLSGTACTSIRDPEYLQATGLLSVARVTMQPRGGDFSVVKDNGKWVVQWDDPSQTPIVPPTNDDESDSVNPSPAQQRLPTVTSTQQGATAAFGNAFGGRPYTSSCYWSGRQYHPAWRWRFNWSC